MKQQQFWRIIDELAQVGGGDGSLYTQLCREKFFSLSLQDLMGLMKAYQDVLQGLVHWDLWGAATVIMGECRLEHFMTFLSNMIGQGSQFVANAQRDPDSLADTWMVPIEDAVSDHRFVLILAQCIILKGGDLETLDKHRGPTVIQGVKWNFDELRTKYPRLAARFHYVPSQGSDMHDALPDGDVIHHSYSTNAPRVRMSIWHCLRHNARISCLPQLVLILYGLGIGLIFLSWVKTSFVFLIPAVLLTVLLARALYQLKLTFYHALLSPGIITSIEPLRVATLTVMSNRPSAPSRGAAIKIINVASLPRHHKRVGEWVPMVCSFDDTPKNDVPSGYWTDFTPMPIAWATSSVKELKRCMEKIGTEPFEELASYVSQRRLPPEPEQVLFLDIPGKVPPPLNPMF